MKNILYIDDEPEVLRVVKEALEHKGYRVLTTSQVAEFQRMLNAERVDLVLLDVQMPEQGGLDLFHDLRQRQKLPVLFVTGYPEEFSMQSSKFVKLWREEFWEGDTDILYKPFNDEVLFEKVASLIGRPSEDLV